MSRRRQRPRRKLAECGLCGQKVSVTRLEEVNKDFGVCGFFGNLCPSCAVLLEDATEQDFLTLFDTLEKAVVGDFE